jgi:hypothetical protein
MSLNSCPPSFKIVKLGNPDAERDAINAALQAIVSCMASSSLPSQSGHAGHYLTTDGTNVSWAAIAAGQVGIQYKDEGTNLGTSGTVDEIDFTGAGVSASRAGNKITVNVTGGGASGHSPGCVFSNVLAATTVTSEIQIPYGGTIEGWTIVGDVAGSVSISVARATYANYDTMTSLFTATCTTSKKAQATGLSHALTAGDILRFTASGFSLFNRVSITLEVN